MVNSMNSAGEVYNEALSAQCIQALKFLNIYASKIHIRKEDVRDFFIRNILGHRTAS